MVGIEDLKQFIYVNIPFSMLVDNYLSVFIDKSLNAEIGLDAHVLDHADADDYKNVKSRFSDAGLKVTLHGPFIDMSPGSPDPEVMELTRRRFDQVVKVARIIGPTSVVLHIGYEQKRYGFVKDKWFENSLETWRGVARGLSNEGTVLCLENVYEEYPEYVLPLFEELEDLGIKFCLDTGHQSAFSRASLEQWLFVLGRYLGQLHLHDNDGEHDQHKAIGSGTIDFSLLLKWLKQHFSDPPIITLEPHTKEGLWPSLEWLGENWPW